MSIDKWGPFEAAITSEELHGWSANGTLSAISIAASRLRAQRSADSNELADMLDEVVLPLVRESLQQKGLV